MKPKFNHQNNEIFNSIWTLVGVMLVILGAGELLYKIGLVCCGLLCIWKGSGRMLKAHFARFYSSQYFYRRPF